MGKHTTILAWSLLILALAGCGGPPGAGPPAGREFQLWQDSSIFSAVRTLLSRPGAGDRLWVEMYEFGRRDLAAGLIAARRRGADVHLIVDRTVAQSARTADRLAEAGLPVRAYPVDDSRGQIDHVKLVLAGGEALVGGMNWGAGSAANHDYALLTAQPAVLSRLDAIFERDWEIAGGRPAPPAPAAAALGGGAVAETTPGQEVRALLDREVRSARSAIAAEVFVLTDPDLIAALAAAQRRGLRVRILLDPGQDSNRYPFRVLAAAGVEARWYPVPRGTLLHAKAGLFDGAHLVLGSANWSHGGLSVNHELDLLSEDPQAAAAFAARFERDWAASGGLINR